MFVCLIETNEELFDDAGLALVLGALEGEHRVVGLRKRGNGESFFFFFGCGARDRAEGRRT